MTSKKAVVGFVSSQAQADGILRELEHGGFANQDISALFPDKRGTRDFALEQSTKAPEGAIMGVSAGGALGGALGFLAGIGALTMPGIGPLIAAGPLMAALSGVAAGAAVGGLTGALVGIGIPEIEAKVYESKVRVGNILLSVHVEDRDQRSLARIILEKGGAMDVVTIGEQSVPAPSRDLRSPHRSGSDTPQEPTMIDLKNIKPLMPIVSSTQGQFAVVECLESRDMIKVTKDIHGQHHYIPMSWVTRVDDQVHISRTTDQAIREWKTSATPPCSPANEPQPEEDMVANTSKGAALGGALGGPLGAVLGGASGLLGGTRSKKNSYY